MRIVLLLLLSAAGFAGGLFGVYLGIQHLGGGSGDGAEADTLAAEAEGVPAGAASGGPLTSVSADTLASLRAQLAYAHRELPRLLTRIDTLESAVRGKADRQARARDLAATLTRLEDRELRSVLAQLDADVLADVYAEAAPRGRIRVLQMLPSGRAATLVERVANADRRPIPSEVRPVSSSPSAPAPRPTGAVPGPTSPTGTTAPGATAPDPAQPASGPASTP